MRRLLVRLRTEQTGSAYAAIELVLVLGIILLPLLAGIAQLPRWVDARSTADLAAQEAARQMVLADTWEEGAAAGEATIATVVSNRGMDVGAVRAVDFGGALVRGGTVTVTVTLQVPPVVLPGVGAVGGNISISRSATERVDDYRQFGE
jgi:hypothetical protein